MKIEIYLKDEPHQVSRYEVPDLATTDLSSWPFGEGTELSFAEIATYIESIDRQLTMRSELHSAENQTERTQVDLKDSGQRSESELEKEIQAPADERMTGKSPETESVNA